MDNRQQMYGRCDKRYKQQPQNRQCYRGSVPSNIDSRSDYKNNDCLDKRADKTIGECVNDLPLAMVYMPMQRWENICDASSGLAQGSIFKDLVKPYCPVLQKRGGR